MRASRYALPNIDHISYLIFNEFFKGMFKNTGFNITFSTIWREVGENFWKFGLLIENLLISCLNFQICSKFTPVSVSRKKYPLWREGNYYRKKLYRNPNFLPTHKYGIYSMEIRNVERNVENLQGELLYEPADTALDQIISNKLVQNLALIELDHGDKTYQSIVSFGFFLFCIFKFYQFYFISLKFF